MNILARVGRGRLLAIFGIGRTLEANSGDSGDVKRKCPLVSNMYAGGDVDHSPGASPFYATIAARLYGNSLVCLLQRTFEWTDA